MNLLQACLSFDIYYLLFRLISILLPPTSVNINTHIDRNSSSTRVTSPAPLDCSNLNCKLDVCVIDDNIGARVCPWLCDDGWRGQTCQRRCSRRCRRCGKQSGVCQICDENWAGLRCSIYKGETENYNFNHTRRTGRKLLSEQQHCPDGWYGESCKDPCPVNCAYSQCDKIGHCDVGCNGRYRGALCDMKCPEHCSKGCNQTSGECFACKPGYYGLTCEKPCITTCSNGICYRNTGKCPHTTSSDPTQTTQTTQPNNGPGSDSNGWFILLGIFIGVVATLFIGFCVSRRMYHFVKKS